MVAAANYSVMQSDGNSFCRYVVFYNVNMSYIDEDSIIDQINEKQIFLDVYCENWKFWEENAYLKKYRGLKNLVLVLVCIFL